MKYRNAVAALAALSLLAGCSTRPRNFAPQMAAPVADAAGFEGDYRTCAALISRGQAANFKEAAATVAATGAGALGGAAVATASFGLAGSITAAGAMVSTMVPGLGLLAGVGASRLIRSSKERKFKTRMSSCLAEHGYQVAEWNRIKRGDDASAVALAASTEPGAAATGGR